MTKGQNKKSVTMPSSQLTTKEASSDLVHINSYHLISTKSILMQSENSKIIESYFEFCLLNKTFNVKDNWPAAKKNTVLFYI